MPATKARHCNQVTAVLHLPEQLLHVLVDLLVLVMDGALPLGLVGQTLRCTLKVVQERQELGKDIGTCLC
jgi:hypothetical protein